MRLTALFQELIEIAEGKITQTAFWLVMALIYLNCILYLMDLYTLVKKKTPGETILIMLLPGTVTVMGAVLFSLLFQLPASPDLERVWMEAAAPGLWTELLCLAGLFAFLWGLTWRLWRKRRENRLIVVRWIFSYSLDFIMVLLLALVGAAGLAAGVNLPVLAGRLTAGLGYNLPLYLFLYGTAALVFKMGLMLLAGLTQLYTARISRFPYREGGNPAAAFLIYAVLCQNARVRGALVFWIPGTWFAFWAGSEVNDLSMKLFFPALTVLAFMLYLLLALRPVAENMARFDKWGDRKQVLARFCREYFLEEPVIKNSDFTVTRHFLVDERGMMEVFSFDALANVNVHNGWVSDAKKGWTRQLSFLDGGCCVIDGSDRGAEEIFKYAGQYWERQQLIGQGDAAQRRMWEPTGTGLYQKLFYFVLVAMILVFFMMYQTLAPGDY
ncbi:MAG: hypothetical protein NC389_12585 [Acetatifactor muris]|nr:hypothetical protein [Acetatifactor muris]